jgi:hypothetical protein
MALALCSLAWSGCEIDTKVKTDGNNPPTFTISGSGGINFLRVYESWESRKGDDSDPVLWHIVPNRGAVSISDLPHIVYGQVPPGFVQLKPSGSAPPPLQEGKVYVIFTPTYGANGGGMVLTIKDGKSVPTTIHQSPPNRETEVAMEAKPLRFVLSGSGALSLMTISAPHEQKVWRIEAENLWGRHVEELHSVTYGVVPIGYKQTVPAEGKAPPPLTAGVRYSYFCMTEEAPSATGEFEMVNDVPIQRN